MNDRVAVLREESLNAEPFVSIERASLITDFYRANEGRYSIPVLRGMAYRYLCENKTIYIGKNELIVGERGPAPKAVPTYPEITCHTVEDLEILNSRPLTWYRVDSAAIELYRKKIIPFWRGRNMRDRMFALLSEEWLEAYDAGIFTEFMEQRAPGHTVLDDKIYRKGMFDFKNDIVEALSKLDFANDTSALAKRENLRGFELACDATIRFAERHAEAAESIARDETDLQRRSELERIAQVCRHVPANAPGNFYEALQSYWFCHLGVITELNGWDSFCPGHLDQHLWPFYKKGIEDGSLTRESAKELLGCFFVKFNNHPAPPKVGVTAAESGTYTDFANINLAGLLPDGSDGSNEVTLLLLEVIDEMHLLQPSNNVQISRKTPDKVLKAALRVIRKGYGFPSVFNADSVVEEQLRQGKTLEDARAGGCSGCVEVGAFGKEAYILTGYFNLPKILELALHNGFDTRTNKQLGFKTGEAAGLKSIDDVLNAFQKQLHHFIDIKIHGNQIIEQLFAKSMPAPFLSVITDDCIKNGMDYNSGGARYNNSFIQAVGIGSITDALSGLDYVAFREKSLNIAEFVKILDQNFEGNEALRQLLLNRVPKYGNDNDRADSLMVRVFNMAFDCIDGRPNTKGGQYRLEMLPTTCHVYFGSVCGASSDGRFAGHPLSEGISPVQGADRNGPTAVIKSAGKMDHVKTGGTLLNMKFAPTLLEGDEGIDRFADLIRAYFKLDGHHVQFNVVNAETLREAQRNPETHRDLIVRVAGYSDYFCDLSLALQEEIIKRTEHAAF
ncbi:MAG: glycyl radical protein [Holophagales bacterium]|jgi:formate C-acetyltransferase|nr:glycyl radical protein [Holophagales bacterium]